MRYWIQLIVVGGFVVVGALAVAPRLRPAPPQLEFTARRPTAEQVLEMGLTVVAVQEPAATRMTVRVAYRGWAELPGSPDFWSSDAFATIASGTVDEHNLSSWLDARHDEMSGATDTAPFGPANGLVVIVSPLGPDEVMALVSGPLNEWEGPLPPPRSPDLTPHFRHHRSRLKRSLGFPTGPRDPRGEAALLVLAEALRVQLTGKVQVRGRPWDTWVEVDEWSFEADRADVEDTMVDRLRHVVAGSFELGDLAARALVTRETDLEAPDTRADLLVGAWLRELGADSVDDTRGGGGRPIHCGHGSA